MSDTEYLIGLVYMNEHELINLANKIGKTEDEVINDMVNLGWTQGIDIYGNYEYWE